MGNLNYMRIWHDNSGRDEKASWYLKNLIIYDLQTKEKFYTVCENWLDSKLGDGKIVRNLIFIQKDEFYRKIKNNERLKEKFSDLHLWYSVFTRPIGSLFSRFNRVTCCFLSIYISMVFATVYYTFMSASNNVSIILNFSQEQVKNFTL